MFRIRAAFALAAVLAAPPVAAQTPQPFPRPATPAPPAAPGPEPVAPAPQAPVPPPTSSTDPTEAELGMPIYPGSRFLASYDAGRGQRYYIFGALAPFADLVQYYRGALSEGGDDVFDQPPTHMFEVGRFRDETMAFPPGVTIKDWTWGGSAGYPNPDPNGQPERFPTIIMIVPPPPAAATER